MQANSRMASLQRDLADDQHLLTGGASGDCCLPGGASVKLNRRSLGGLAFDIQFDEGGTAAVDAGGAGGPESPGRKARGPPAAASGQQQQQPQLSTEEIAQRLAAAELRREQALAQRVDKLESKLSHVSGVSERLRREAEERAEQCMKTVEETLKAAEERREESYKIIKQRVRGQSAGAKERIEAMRKQQEAAKQLLEAELERDIREKEARRKEQLEKIVQGAQQHLARVEDVRAQRQNGAEAPVADD